jgi:type II secretory pathway predicted ATPase ExeA
MYLSYYNLSDWPFQINADPRFLWLGEKHKEALATLIYGVQDQRGFLLLTGDVGTGKTTLVNALLEKLDESVLVGNITDPKLDLIGFLRVVSASLGVHDKVERKENFLALFERFLNEKYRENKYVLLIIDEAHTLSLDHLEQIRLLSNIELPEQRLISIFLVGQDEINKTLISYECRALRQRLTLICRVEPLSKGETAEYISHRLRIAGTERDIFSRAAVREIHRFSRGYPRLINILCDHALLTGYVRESKVITPALITESGRELLLPGEHVESLPTLPKNLEQASSTDSKQHPEESEPKRLWPGGTGRGEASSRAQPFRSWVRAKSPLRWAVWVCALLLILSLTIISRTDRFSAPEGEQPAAPADDSPAVHSPSSSPTAATVPMETPAAKEEAPEIDEAAAPPVPAGQQEPHEPGALARLSDEAKENHPGEETIAETGEKAALDSVERAVRQQDFEGAIQLSEDIMATDASPPPGLKALYLDALLNQAETISGMDVVSSEDLLNKAIAVDPMNFRALLLLAKLYTAQEKHGKAIETYEKATVIEPDMPGLFFNLGFLYAARDDYALAEGAFARAVELSPSYLDQALFNLAVVQYRQGKRDKTLQSLRKALEVNPQNLKARGLLETVAGVPGDRS